MEGSTTTPLERLIFDMANHHLIAQLLAAEFARSSDPAATADQWLRLHESICDVMTFPDVDPAQSDLAAQMFRDTVMRQLHRARALATGQPFDPATYQRRAG